MVGYSTNKDAIKNRIWRENNPEKQMMRGVMKRKREKGYEVGITHEDIKIPEHCPILGIPLVRGGGDAAPTLDRIDNALGYIPGNIQVISYRANRLKSDATPQELILMGEWAKKEVEL